ncbi:hypothetical protein HXA31_20530 [Salipaludibacillus agaradhaerens]|jgi:hypothetical protein|uniref:Uncharacterized protein n=1 Tax=Salipaludibacillus agaradhaerens TaxID=76935 RepID=A0A9Q4B2E1_SALAG|nr:hypothetical protein [Salipaludibacillus agaradhaerens]MCR6096875.1 hypothetical protein [Salipaludibacillus agaradhaerens]MCR6116719.1 hypothetical protein [Salipaludibacillus agaradhaerens]
MKKALGYIKNKRTGQVLEFYDISPDGYELSPGRYGLRADLEDWEEMEEPDTINQPSHYKEKASKIGELVDKKNAQYGDSFNKSGEFLKILYPEGIKPNQYKDALALVRIFDKQMRIANGNQGDENAYKDICGYGLLMS